MRRIGECNQCGECCSPPTKERLEAYQSLGIVPEGQHLKRCPSAGYVDGKIVCQDYENRGQMCRDFPRSPVDIMALPNCSYIFEEGR